MQPATEVFSFKHVGNTPRRGLLGMRLKQIIFRRLKSTDAQLMQPSFRFKEKHQEVWAHELQTVNSRSNACWLGIVVGVE